MSTISSSRRSTRPTTPKNPVRRASLSSPVAVLGIRFCCILRLRHGSAAPVRPLELRTCADADRHCKTVGDCFGQCAPSNGRRAMTAARETGHWRGGFLADWMPGPGRERQLAATPVSRRSTPGPLPAKVGFLAPPRTHAVGHNRSYREPKDRVATDWFTRYCGRRPSSVRGAGIPKAAARCLSIPKARRQSAAPDVEWAQPTQRRSSDSQTRCHRPDVQRAAVVRSPQAFSGTRDRLGRVRGSTRDDARAEKLSGRGSVRSHETWPIASARIRARCSSAPVRGYIVCAGIGAVVLRTSS